MNNSLFSLGEETRQTSGEKEFLSEMWWPLDAPGMPPIGDDIENYVDFLLRGKRVDPVKRFQIIEKIYKELLRRNDITIPVFNGTSLVEVSFIPGHIWGKALVELYGEDDFSGPDIRQQMNYYKNLPLGPIPCEVMVVGKLPGHEELLRGYNFVGPSGAVFYNLVRKLNFTNYKDWYITNLVKFRINTNKKNLTLRANWIKTCLPLLHQELRIVRPRYILCLGADALKGVLGRKYTLSSVEGKIEKLVFPVHKSVGESPQYHECYVMATIHPAEVARDASKYRFLESSLSRFRLLLEDKNLDYLSSAEKSVKHRVIKDCNQLQELLNSIPDSCTMVSWDCEWQGRNPIQRDGYLRCIQFSWEPYNAAVVKITEPGGQLSLLDPDTQSPDLKRLAHLLNEFMRNRRAVGHFLVADLEWLHYYGINPIRYCPIPSEVDEEGLLPWQQYQKGKGWLDTAIAVHSIEETSDLGLEMLAMRYTTAPRWDLPLEEYKKHFCKTHGISLKKLKGYGDIPDEYLFPYAAYDADVTLRIMLKVLPLLDNDYEGHCCWEPFWETMFVQEVILSMHKTGVFVDRERIVNLTKSFLEARYALEEKIINWAQWPDLNLRSLYQIRELVYGERYNGKGVRLRPQNAKSLYVRPILDTSDPPRTWDEVEREGNEHSTLPSTSKFVFNLLVNENPDKAEVLGWLRDYRYIDQVLRTVLRPPVEDESSGEWVTDDDGNYVFEEGLASHIDPDNRIRTRFLPTAETGRWRSSSPNLQNISKSRDVDYERLLGERYQHKLRSILIASGWLPYPKLPERPEHLQWSKDLPGEICIIKKTSQEENPDKKVLIEFDYKGAELFGLAVMAGDEKMIDHVVRSQYPESGYDEHGKPCPDGKYPHPDYYDIHSNIAVLAFNLDCPPTKSALKEAGKAHLRNLIKKVVFGTLYGGGPKSLALQSKEYGTDIDVDVVQRVIDTIFEVYPKVESFQRIAKKYATTNRWIVNCFGRYRRFSKLRVDSAIEAEIERQAINFPIQSLIASVMNRGLGYLHREILKRNLYNHIKIILQIHDAAVLEVSIPYINLVINELLPYAMRDCVPIYPTHLDGKPTGRGPYYLNYEISIEKNWGEKLTAEECELYNIVGWRP